MKTPGMDKFSERLDQIFEQGMPTKAQILDAYNKFASQSSATDKLIIEKQEELIKAWEKTSIMAGASKYIKMTEKISRLEAELQALKDKRDAIM